MPALMVGVAPPPSHLPWEHTQRTAPLPCPQQPPVREIVTWELAQKYFVDPTFGGALVPGRRNVFTSTVDLTGIAFLTDAAPPLAADFAPARLHRARATMWSGTWTTISTRAGSAPAPLYLINTSARTR